jgi:deoxyribonuclease V
LSGWPASRDELVRRQSELGRAPVEPWRPSRPVPIAGCFVCFAGKGPGAGSRGDPAWAGATLMRGVELLDRAVVRGQAGAPYEPGLLALREGPLLESAVRALAQLPGVMLVNASGRDHPRRAGLALELGAVLEVPSIGVTDRPLLAEGGWPPAATGSTAPLSIEGEVVACRLRTRRGVRPVVVHAAWRTDLETAIQVVLGATARARTPEPLRQARRLARRARASGT